jgi:hypothetical protein
MMNKITIALVAFSLSGCGVFQDHIQPIKTEYKVVIPEDKYFTCDVTKLPDAKTLKMFTDAQVAQLINDLYRDVKICHNNMQGIKTYLQAAQDVLSKK